LQLWAGGLLLRASFFTVPTKRIFGILAVLAVAVLSDACERQPYQQTRMFTHHGEEAAHGGAGTASSQEGAKSGAKSEEQK
jgi:hypothetical protein